MVDGVMTEYPSLLGAIERALRAEEDTWDPTVIHVSDVATYGTPLEEGGFCPLQLYARLNSWDGRKLTAGELLMFDRGRSLHERAAELLMQSDIYERTGWSVAFVEHSVLNEQAAGRLGVLPDPVKKGRLDVELHGGKDGRGLLIYDWKTVRGRAFQYIPQRGAYVTHQNQVGTYMMARDADGGGIVYLDREGQNFGMQENVERRDDEVMACAERVREIAQGDAPPPLEPVLRVRENKGPNSVYLDEPFQCQRCVYRDFACPGALAYEHRDLGIVAKIDDKRGLVPKTEHNIVLEWVERLLAAGSVTYE